MSLQHAIITVLLNKNISVNLLKNSSFHEEIENNKKIQIWFEAGNHRDSDGFTYYNGINLVIKSGLAPAKRAFNH
jgi:hypothetical protein